MHPDSPVTQGMYAAPKRCAPSADSVAPTAHSCRGLIRATPLHREWLLWMDDDAIFTDMNFTFPFEECAISVAASQPAPMSPTCFVGTTRREST